MRANCCPHLRLLNPRRGKMFRKSTPTFTFCTLLACFLLTAIVSFAQSQASTGNIVGRVVDPSGAVIPNAAVSAINDGTGLEKTTTTDGEGNYRIILLSPGTYTVKATAPGFAVSPLR